MTSERSAMARQLRAEGAPVGEVFTWLSALYFRGKLGYARRFARVVLLGSIATGKYTDILLAVFGRQLLFPGDFVGRGDMSRGGLLLRASRGGDELGYVPVAGATLHGPRPPRLPQLRRA